MPMTDDPSQGATQRLDKRLDTLEAERQPKPGMLAGQGSSSEGYRLLGQMLGGVLGGAGLGWVADHFAHTSPWGVIAGLLIGAAISIYATVRAAQLISTRAEAKARSATAAKDADEA
ncbi:MAG TPA: AtpZ/AtpI family protein [Caulobacteraceae bacterium]